MTIDYDRFEQPGPPLRDFTVEVDKSELVRTSADDGFLGLQSAELEFDESLLQFSARRFDPESSQHAALDSFDADDLVGDVRAVADEFMDGIEFIMAITGWTRVLVKKLLRLNKVWTICNELWKAGEFEREDAGNGHLIRWRRRRDFNT